MSFERPPSRSDDIETEKPFTAHAAAPGAAPAPATLPPRPHRRILHLLRKQRHRASSSAASWCGWPRNEPGQESSLALGLRVERAASVGAAMRGWMADGRAVHCGHVFHAVNRLRRHHPAGNGMDRERERLYKLSEPDYSYLLEFTAKVHGISEGKSLFLCVPQEYQKELLYNSLVMAALDLGLIKHSYAYMRKMRELSLPISPYVYNRLIILHSSPIRRKTISKIFYQMKANRVIPLALCLQPLDYTT